MTIRMQLRRTFSFDLHLVSTTTLLNTCWWRMLAQGGGEPYAAHELGGMSALRGASRGKLPDYRPAFVAGDLAARCEPHDGPQLPAVIRLSIGDDNCEIAEVMANVLLMF